MSQFYTARHLSVPVDEHVPKDVDELAALITGGAAEAPRPKVIVGDGQYVRDRVIAGQPFDAVRTDQCNHLLELDRQSNLVRVEAGIRWGMLRDKLRDEGFSLQGYRPYPSTATVGGLLARSHAGQPHRLSGDIRQGCVALSAVSPTLGHYRYLEAPRKASGPDLRHLFIGGEGLLGVILTVTLNISKPFPGRLFEWDAPTVRDAAARMRRLARRGLRRRWCHWSSTDGRFRAAVYGPTRLLDGITRSMDVHGESPDEAPDSGGRLGDGVRRLRRTLEADLPGRRAHAGAARTVALTASLAQLGGAVDRLEHVDQIDIVDWSAHAATAVVQFDHAPADGWTVDDWQGFIDVRPVVGEPPVDWPQWVRILKARFDSAHTLAVGP